LVFLLGPLFDFVFGDAEFFVDFILGMRQIENLNDENDERSLRGHVEAERKTDETHGVKGFGEPMDNEGENKPDYQGDNRKILGFCPVLYTFFGR
jgi:hypothetical protein